MKLDIDEDLIKEAQERYTGADTTAKGLVTWLLRAFADLEISQIQHSMGPPDFAGQPDPQAPEDGETS